MPFDFGTALEARAATVEPLEGQPDAFLLLFLREPAPPVAVGMDRPTLEQLRDHILAALSGQSQARQRH